MFLPFVVEYVFNSFQREGDDFYGNLDLVFKKNDISIWKTIKLIPKKDFAPSFNLDFTSIDRRSILHWDTNTLELPYNSKISKQNLENIFNVADERDDITNKDIKFEWKGNYNVTPLKDTSYQLTATVKDLHGNQGNSVLNIIVHGNDQQLFDLDLANDETSYKSAQNWFEKFIEKKEWEATETEFIYNLFSSLGLYGDFGFSSLDSNQIQEMWEAKEIDYATTSLTSQKYFNFLTLALNKNKIYYTENEKAIIFSKNDTKVSLKEKEKWLLNILNLENFIAKISISNWESDANLEQIKVTFDNDASQRKYTFNLVLTNSEKENNDNLAISNLLEAFNNGVKILKIMTSHLLILNKYLLIDIVFYDDSLNSFFSQFYKVITKKLPSFKPINKNKDLSKEFNNFFRIEIYEKILDHILIKIL